MLQQTFLLHNRKTNPVSGKQRISRPSVSPPPSNVFGPVVFIMCRLVRSTSFPVTEENCFYFYKTPEKNTHPYCYLPLKESRSLLSEISVLLNCRQPRCDLHSGRSTRSFTPELLLEHLFVRDWSTGSRLKHGCWPRGTQCPLRYRHGSFSFLQSEFEWSAVPFLECSSFCIFVEGKSFQPQYGLFFFSLN